MKEIDLTKPDDCRWYCEHFEIPGKGKIGFVKLSTGREIHFLDMTDEDAILVANQLYEMEIEGVTRAKKRVLDNGGLIQ